MDNDQLTTFPLFAVREDGSCACGKPECKAIGKHPARRWGCLTKGEKLPIPKGYGTGIVTGDRSGIFVLDLDSEEAILWAEGQGLPKTYTVRTGRNVGVQIYFKHPGFYVVCSASKVFPKADIKGDGGMVVAAGTRHKSGHLYEVISDADVPIADAPAWLLEWPGLRGVSLADRQPSSDAPTPVTGEVRERHMKRAREYRDGHLPETLPDGNRRWNMAVYLIRREELSVEDARELLTEPIDGGLSYAERFEDGWDDYNIRHKLLDARDHFREDRATVDRTETFGKRVVEISKPAALKALVEVPGRRRPDPHHAYTHVPGHNAAASERRKLPLTDAIQALTSHPAWAGVLQFDVFRRRPIAVNPPLRMDLEITGLTNSDVAGVRTWFEANGVQISKDDTSTAIEAASRQGAFHPILEWLDALPPGDPALLDTLAERVLGVSEHHATTFLRLFLVGAVRRILSPGCKMDSTLVLVGPQGCGKSTFVSALFGEEFTRSEMPDLSSKDASIALAGFWAVELAELDRVLRGSDEKTVKEFLTRTFDDYRPPYERADQRFPRACVFVGTTNEDDFIRDATGGRRFLPIGVHGKIDTSFLREHRAEIWAAALALARTDVPHWLADESQAEEARAQFVQRAPHHDEIADYCAGREWVKPEDIYRHVIARGEGRDGLIARMTQREIAPVRDTLRRLGCVTGVRWIDRAGGKKERAWRTPDALREREPSREESLRRASERLAATSAVN